MGKKWDILIVPNTQEQGFNFSVTARALKLSILAMCFLIITSFAFCAGSIHAWKKGNLRRVDNLEKEIEARDSKLSALDREFANLISLEEKLRTMAGLKPRHTTAPTTGMGGQGGREFGETILYATNHYLQPDLLSEAENMSADALLRAVIATQDSFSEILEAFEKEQQRLSSIPSINPVLSPDAWISSGFGNRKDPINGERRFHEGADIVAPLRSPVIAPADGVVTFSGWRNGLGRTLEIRHGYGYRTIYGHNEKLLVKKGDHVKRGDSIALLGRSGRSTGPHLHYEIRLNGKLINPYRYVIE
ncbi:MAG: M23 family metallopeptidase [Candidatus Hydrogenedentota bacterium]|nr:MAG: M23 family metallopeptidase [Candidatus Hydrogenedentota bacterium]